MIRLTHPEYLYALALLPLLWVLFLLAARARKRSLRRMGNLHVLEALMPAAGKYKRMVKFLLVTVALGLLVAALANPQIGTRIETVKREGVDILIALDVSNSMKAEDFRPNRLENARRQISLMLDKLQQDRIGIVVFAGSSHLQLPLTTDYGAARLFLSAVDTDIVPVQGTAIGSAIQLAVKSFVKGERKHRVIIVITDGENHEDDAIAAARDAEKEGVVIHTIGMGSPGGAPIPVYQNETRVGFLKDADGSVVITKLNEVVLQQIASEGRGKYVLATSSQNELDIIFREIESMEKKEIGAREFTDFEHRFQFPLGAAIVLLILEFFLSERKNLWGKKVKSWMKAAAIAVAVMNLSSLPAFAESERSLVRSGNRQYEEEQFDEAEVSYRKALEKDRELAQGIFNLGDALYKQERYAEAADQFRAAASKAPDDSSRAQAYHNLGNSLLKDKKLEESIESYKQALKLNPEDLDTKYNLEYARRLLQQQKQQQQQDQDQKKEQDKDKEKQKDQGKDQEKQQQQEKQEQKEQKENRQNQSDPKEQEQKQREQEQEQPQQAKDQISRKDAERILEALKNDEKNVQKKMLKKAPAKVKVGKEW